MFKWAQQALANVAGTQEPIYGPSAIKSVAEEAKDTPYTELTKADLVWERINSTSVETKTFYLISDEGRLGMAQIIYSNVAGIRTTVQFTCKVFSETDNSADHLWSSNALSNVEISEDHQNLYADDCAMEISEDGNSYTIKSLNDDRAIVNLKITKAAPGWQAGKTGKTLFGTDLTDPWGSMRHAFWPRCVAEGTITTKDGPINYNGKALFIHALQGMKPHHAAARWNFVDFQGPTYSAVLMNFTTPPSYGSTEVTVACIAKDGELLMAGTESTVTHTTSKEDPESGWPEPSTVKWQWTGQGKDGPVEAVYDGPLAPRTDRVDVMAEVPGFVKTIVASAAGTKPYIYQYKPKITIKFKIGGEEISEEGHLFSEATFITE